jgi:hypothetical protein
VLVNAIRERTIKLRALWLTSVNQHDDAVQAKLSWQVTSSVTIGVAFERFYAIATGYSGSFAMRHERESVWNRRFELRGFLGFLHGGV